VAFRDKASEELKTGRGTSRLISEANGCKGLLRVPKGPQINELSLAEPKYPSQLRVLFDAAGLASVVQTSHGQDEIAHIEHPVQGCLERLERIVDISKVLADALMPVIGAALGNDGEGGVPLDCRIGDLEKPIDVARAEPGGDLKDYISVLPGHCSASIA
jgi:hypothetical protein